MESAPEMDRRKVIDTAMAFPMGAILQRYKEENELPDEVISEHERELKRYLIICALFPRENIGMFGAVDQLWHTFLLFTIDYHKFCKRLGSKFIHHVPKEKNKREVGGYALFLKRYKEVYKEAPPVHIWPSAKPKEPGDAGSCDVGCSGSCGPCDVNCSGSCGPCDVGA